jgi:hypothetical protein
LASAAGFRRRERRLVKGVDVLDGQPRADGSLLGGGDDTGEHQQRVAARGGEAAKPGPRAQTQCGRLPSFMISAADDPSVSGEELPAVIIQSISGKCRSSTGS